MRELEDGTIERVLPEGGLVSEPPQPDDGPATPGADAPDQLTAEPDAQAAWGTWKFFRTESCLDLFSKKCSADSLPLIPLEQCETGSACAYFPGATCYEVNSQWSVDVLRCRL